MIMDNQPPLPKRVCATTSKILMSAKAMRLVGYPTYLAIAICVWLVLKSDLSATYGPTATICIVVIAVSSAGFLFRHVEALLWGSLAILCIYCGLDTINLFKISTITFPLTIMDLRMFLADPSGLWTALNLPAWSYAAARTLFYVSIITGLSTGAWLAFSLWRTASRFSLVDICCRAALIAAIIASMNSALISSVDAFQRQHRDELGLWEDDGLAKFSKAVGVFGFLLYSHFIEDGGRTNFLSYTPSEASPQPSEIAQATQHLLQTDKLTSRTAPNIILIHAESTFDPNDVFRLKTEAKNDLFYSTAVGGPNVHYHGPILVNTIGGKSWMTEFEVLVGLDSRIFGVAGQYTHASLSPFTQRTIVKYLLDRGYHTSAYTTDSGAFYNTENAYRTYGFQEFFSRNVIGYIQTDTTIVERAISLSKSFKAPFFKYILLKENHAPHWCDKNQAYEPIQFDGQATDTQNCALVEYLRRAHSTEKAVQMAQQYLQAEQARTGRPYLLVIYGDHQPYSFTGGGGKQHNMGLDLDAFRTDQSKRRTILKVISSTENVIRCCWKKEVPVTLVPTLISAYVADSPEALYLPANLYQYDQCGSDWIGGLVLTTYYGRAFEQEHKLCPAFERLLSAYKQEKVVGLPVETSENHLAENAQQTMPSCTAPEFTSGDTEISLRATGTKFIEAPTFRLYVDGTVLGEGTVETAPDTQIRKVSQGEIEQATMNFKFKAKLNSGSPKAIEVEFLNDHWAGPQKPGDSNLWVQSVKIGDREFGSNDFRFEDHDGFLADRLDNWVVLLNSGKIILPLTPTQCS